MAAGNVFGSDDALNVALVQMDGLDATTMDEVGQNVEALRRWIDRACSAYPGLDLVVFPECSTQGAHPAGGRAIAIEVPGSVTERLQEKCRECKVWAHFNFIEAGPGESTFNTSVIVDARGEIVLKYHKVNPFVPLEGAVPGDELPVCAGPKGSTLGIMLCYDGDFPEVGRELAFKGADILLRPAAYMEPYSAPWTFVNRTRAYENMAYVVAVNRVGTTHLFTWFGRSMAVDYEGQVLVEAPAGVSWLTKVELFPQMVQRARKQYRTGNHLHNLKHRGCVGLPPNGATGNPYSFYRNWK